MAELENKEYKSYIFTKDKTTCTGCGACAQVCKHDALCMMPDEDGFLHPVLNPSNCINCGLCDKTCPVVHQDLCVNDYNQRCFLATTSRKDYYQNSASIGLCTMLSDYIVNQGGIVFGSYLDESEWTAYQLGVCDVEGVRKIRNSKYLQSNTKKTFLEVKDNLRKGCKVLYIGTPCQIGGLKAFLRKDYENLYTIDIICHGTFSPKLMPLEVDYWQRLFGARICNFRFRSKRVFKHVNGGMVNFDIMSKNGKIRHIERHASASPSYSCYAYSPDGNSYNIRLSCYKCPFRAKERYADLTIGDPWKVLDKKLSLRGRFSSRNKIRSVYSENTSKGAFLISQIRELIDIQEYSWGDLFCQDAALPTNRIIPEKRAELFKRISLEEYESVVEDITESDLRVAHRKFVKTYFIEEVKSVIRPILSLIRR